MQDVSVDDTIDRLRSELGEPGEAAARAIGEWASGRIPFVPQDMLRTFVARAPADLLVDSFWQVVPFGTGGRRGTVGLGPNRVNHSLVALTIQGHADFLRAHTPGDDLAVVVANDVRVFNDISGALSFLDGSENVLLGTSSRTFARLAAEVYAANGISVYFPEPARDDAVLTTPELSFAIRRLAAHGGINISASHNPPDDNGIKIYDSNGAQFVAPADELLNRAVESPSPVRWKPFDEAVGEGIVRDVPRDVHEAYVSLYTREFARTRRTLTTQGRVVYTPLCGSGLSSTGEVLEAIGVAVAVPEDQGPDGTFSPLPFRAPNPEVPQATAPARAYADTNEIGCVISTDPDADRVGVDVLHQGEWVHLTGNQIAAIVAYYLLGDPEGPKESGLVVETLVTTKLLREIAHRSPGSQIVDDLLVGFKYVAEVLRSLETTGSFGGIRSAADSLVIAAEESHGILTVPDIRDKDATSAAIYLAPLHCTLAARGETLVDYFEHILRSYGVFGESARSIVLRGNRGVRRMEDLMESLRRDPPHRVADVAVDEVVDYWDETTWGPFSSKSDRLSRNVVQWKGRGLIVTVRPSGTEPKIKLYVQTTPDYDVSGRPRQGETSLIARASGAASLAASKVYVEVLARMGHDLSDAAALLPDLVELDQKIEFDRSIAPEVLRRIRAGQAAEELVPWLRQAATAVIPGADPLPAVEASLQLLLGEVDDLPPAKDFMDLVRREIATPRR